MRRGFVEFLQRTADKYGVTKIVHIGDLVDWAAISYHEKSLSLRDPSCEYKKALKQVASLRKAFPKAEWLIGNHDALTERQATSAGLPAEVFKNYNEMWEVDWNVHPRFSKIDIDNVLYCHGDSGRGGMNAALNNAKDQFRSVVMGHFHSQAGVTYWANQDSRVFGLAVGCGIDHRQLAFAYGRKFSAKPVLGCGVVVNGKQGFFIPWLLPCH
jgi:metallophosphoesterase superfamily enzyme